MTNRLETNKATTFGSLLVAALLTRSLPATKPAHAKTLTVDHTSDGGDAVRDPGRRTKRGWILETLLAAFVGILVVAGPVFAVLPRSDIKLFVDGKRKGTFSYDRARDLLSFQSPTLSIAQHTVKVVATDAGGLSTTRQWSFRVVR